MHVCVCVCTFSCMHACMYVCMCTHTHNRARAHTHTHTRARTHTRNVVGNRVDMLRALKHTLGVCLRLLFIGERARLRENPQVFAQPEQSISNVVFYTCIHIDIHRYSILYLIHTLCSILYLNIHTFCSIHTLCSILYLHTLCSILYHTFVAFYTFIM